MTNLVAHTNETELELVLLFAMQVSEANPASPERQENEAQEDRPAPQVRGVLRDNPGRAESRARLASPDSPDPRASPDPPAPQGREDHPESVAALGSLDPLDREDLPEPRENGDLQAQLGREDLLDLLDLQLIEANR